MKPSKQNTAITERGPLRNFKFVDSDHTPSWLRCNGTVVEPRYIGDIIDGIISDGLSVST